jgi:hypothetical protein
LVARRDEADVGLPDLPNRRYRGNGQLKRECAGPVRSDLKEGLMKRFRRRHGGEEVERTAVTRDIPGVVAAWTGGATAREQEVADDPGEPPQAPEEEVADDPGEPPEAPEEEVASRDSEPAAAEATARNRVSLSSATFEDLRALGLSVTQATRLLRRREKQGGFESVDDLDELPGFPSSLRAELKSRVEV